MKIISQILIGLIAFQHLYILWIEMFAWTTVGRKVFRGFPREFFHTTKAMAANQGLYNGFLAVGLVWSLLISDKIWSFQVSLFFLACVITAGVFGAFTADKKIFFVQALPAMIAMAVLFLV
jgi:putative membrane protein